MTKHNTEHYLEKFWYGEIDTNELKYYTNLPGSKLDEMLKYKKKEKIEIYKKAYYEGKVDINDFMYHTHTDLNEATNLIQRYQRRQTELKKAKAKKEFTVVDEKTIYKYISKNDKLYVYNFEGKLISNKTELTTANRMALEMQMYTTAQSKIEKYKNSKKINSKDIDLLAKWSILINAIDLLDDSNAHLLLNKFSFNIANDKKVGILTFSEYIKVESLMAKKDINPKTKAKMKTSSTTNK